MSNLYSLDETACWQFNHIKGARKTTFFSIFKRHKKLLLLCRTTLIGFIGQFEIK